MRIFNKKNTLEVYISKQRNSNKSIGFVPTMGALHEGHLSLVRTAIAENDIVICSIYVNPTQFDNTADLQKYPKTLEEDKILLEKEGCHILFAPSSEEMYPKPSLLKFDFGTLECAMEGKYRQGHFSGVATVVSKFFNIIKPDVAYFGQKDLQQLMIIKQLVSDLSFPIKIVGHPIVREEDGLAMSSRNQRLNTVQRKTAPHIYKSLQKATQLLFEKSNNQIKDDIRHYLGRFEETKLEYLEIVNAETLLPLDTLQKGIPLAICIAAFVGDIRLIDNVIL